jgi:alpha-tubulin suppressor-like RCC1 family protein
LSDTTKTDRQSAVPLLMDREIVEDLIQFAAGYHHSTLLKSDGTVYSIGQNTV